MVRIKLIAVGKLKEKFFRDAVEEYQKRLTRYAQLEIVELPDVSVPDDPSEAQIRTVLEKEGAAIAKHIPPRSYVVALCVDGQQKSSEAFAEFLREPQNGDVTFLIGGSHGLADSIVRSAQCRLSFSAMTFPHQLMRIIFLEQLYRAFKINAGERYHK